VAKDCKYFFDASDNHPNIVDFRNLLTRDVRDVKRLYLSGAPFTRLCSTRRIARIEILTIDAGNPLKPGFLTEPCYNLLYLELAACRLTTLPDDLSKIVPNLRVLNLNYNFLEDVRPLEGLTRLRKLTIIGSRLKGTKPLIRLLQRMPDVEMLDFRYVSVHIEWTFCLHYECPYLFRSDGNFVFDIAELCSHRMNPCTLGWYLPLLVKDVPGALQPSEGNADGKGGRAGTFTWQELDSKFRRDLPDESYIGRLAYRGLIMRSCPRIRMVDGVEVTEKERAKAHHLLQGILGKGKKSKMKGKTAL
jgi:hypothetical protein